MVRCCKSSHRVVLIAKFTECMEVSVKKRQKTAPLGAVFSTLSTALKPARLAALQWPWDLCGPERPVWSGTACVVLNGLCGPGTCVVRNGLCGAPAHRRRRTSLRHMDCIRRLLYVVLVFTELYKTPGIAPKCLYVIYSHTLSSRAR